MQNLTTEEIKSDSLTLSWSFQNEIACQPDEYSVEYELIVRDQCETLVDPERFVHGILPDTSVKITGLAAHSTYTMYIYPINNNRLGEETSITEQTAESGNESTRFQL